MRALPKLLLAPLARLGRLFLLFAMLLGSFGDVVGIYHQPAAAAEADLSQTVGQTPAIITYSENGFSPANLTIKPGQTVIWRNESANTLALKGSPRHRLHLPMLVREASANQAAAQAVPARNTGGGTGKVHFQDIRLATGLKFSYKYMQPGSYSFSDGNNAAFAGTINVLAPPVITDCADLPANSDVAAEQGMPGLLYATRANGTLLRWYWADCTTATFEVYRSANGGPEQLVATVTPTLDPAAAEDLLNTTEPRWPELVNYFSGRLLTQADFQRDDSRPLVTDLYHYAYLNRMAGVFWSNQRYPLALMLGWGYLDSDITPGTSYTYRVEAVEADRTLGTVALVAGKPTPLARPTGLESVALDLEDTAGNWGTAQRNRRYDSQIYLNWNTTSSSIGGDPNASALVIGYDVFRGTSFGFDGRFTGGVNVSADDVNDAAIVPGPQNSAEGELPYMFRYNPGDYADHAFCVAPRDLFNQQLSWPAEANRCSDPVTVAARDLVPPAMPNAIRAEALANSTEVTIRWAHPEPADVDSFIVQRSQDLHCAAGVCWTDVITVAGNSFSHIDAATPCANDPENQNGCWYRVIASDSAGNRSAPSQAVYATNYDTLPPQSLDISQYDCPGRRNSPNCVDIDTDAESIRVNCVFTPGGDEMFVVEIDADAADDLDMGELVRRVYDPPFDLEDVRCRFILVDLYGNQSELDDSPVITIDVDSDNPDQLPQPVISEIVTTQEGANDWAATVHWEMAAHPMLGSFVVERTRESNGSTLQFLLSDGSVRSYNDPDVVLNERYRYVVRAVAVNSDVNDTLSEPRAHRILPGENRPLVELPWVGTSPQRDAATGVATLQVATGIPGAAAQPIYYAVFRSLSQNSNYTQITPILQSSGQIFYEDEQAQRCYFYVVTTFRTRDGEPVGYTDPRRPAGCAQLVPQIRTPGADVAAPNPPAPLCAPAQHSIAPAYNFRFGGGFQVVVESLNDDFTGPSRVAGTGFLLLETAEETLSVPINFDNLRVDSTGRVCSGNVVVSLASLGGGGAHVRVFDGWHYQITGMTLQPWFTTNNVALANINLFSGAAFTNFDSINEQASRIELTNVPMLNSLRFTYQENFLRRGGHTCSNPEVAFRLETLPLEVIPTGMVTIDEHSITMSAACTRYVDRYSPGVDPMVSVPSTTPGPKRSMNDGYLAEPMFGNGVSFTPAGLDGNFSNDADLLWYSAYPFATRVQATNGLDLSIVDGQITGGTISAGDIYTSYHSETSPSSAVSIVQSTFANLAIGSRGDLTGALTLGAIEWDAFAMQPTPNNNWTLYIGALTTPGLPATHETPEIGRAIMWEPSPTGATPIAIPGGALPGLLEPGLNRRVAGSTLSWNNCGANSSFNNVAVDAYVRHSGVTQRHIPLYDAGSVMDIHGYRFIPERFDLQFLDNALLDYEIEGLLDLPFPSDIEVQLVDGWLTGDIDNPGSGEAACLGGASIPEGEQEHTLAYWALQTHLTSIEFRQRPVLPTRLWFNGALRNLPHLRIGDGEARLPAELAFLPDGNFLDHPRNGPKYNRADYRFQGFPYLLEQLRLSDWYGNGSGEQPAWEQNASVNDAPAAALWNVSGFVGLRGVPVAPYFGPISIAPSAAGDNTVITAWNAQITGFPSQPRVSKEWVKLKRVNLTFDYDQLVHAYHAASGEGRFAGFKDYRFVPDNYATIEQLNQLQVLQLDTGVVLDPQELHVFLGLGSGVGTLRALSEAQGVTQPELIELQTWGVRLGIPTNARAVYIAQLATVVQNDPTFSYRETTAALDGLPLASLIDEDYVGGSTEGLLAARGVNIRRLRGMVELEGEGLETQFRRFQLSTQVEIQGREQAAEEIIDPPALPENPAIAPRPPLFYAERMTLSIERHGDFTLIGKNVQSSVFEDTLESFDATLVINATLPQFEGGLTLNGLKTGSVDISSASAVMGIGAEFNYMGLAFEADFNVGIDQVEVGGELLAGVVNPNSTVLQNNFAEVMARISNDLENEPYFEELESLAGFYMRAYGNNIPIIGSSCALSLKGDAELAFWYWQFADTEQVGGLLKPAVYGQVLCAVNVRGSISLEYHYIDEQDTFLGEGYVAGGVGKCEPGNWGNWGERWWNDNLCYQAGAGLAVTYATDVGWDVIAEADAEPLFGD
jgi:plastocyanin